MTLVATDDTDHRSHLADRLGARPGIEVVDAPGTALGVTEALQSRPVDLLLIDARLPPDGARVALEQLPEAPPAVVVTSAASGDGLWAYALGAVDCLPEHADDARLTEAVERARDRVLQVQLRTHREGLLGLLKETGITTAPPAPDGPIVVRSGSQLVFLDPDEIDTIEAAGVYVEIRVGATRHLVRESLRHVEERLDPARFVRIHRSTILNLDRVRKIVPHFNGGAVVVLKDGAELKMSRSYRERIHASLG
ncbi:MAG: LytTR family DNA-binding domain-containing protein [Bacteroidota bacterium]